MKWLQSLVSPSWSAVVSAVKEISSRSKSFFLSTRLRTTLWYSVLFLLLEIIIGFIIYYYLYQKLNEQLDFSLTKQAKAILTYFAENKPEFDTFEPDSLYHAPDELVWDIIYDAVALNPRNSYIQISYNDKIIYKSDNLKKNEIELKNFKPGKDVQVLDLVENEISTEPLRVAALEADKYKIIVGFPLIFVSETLKYLRDIYLVLFPIFFLVAVLGGTLISTKALSRLDLIIKKTDEITAQNLNEKIDGEQYSDEYGRLVKRLNGMMARIRDSFSYLNQFSIAASHELKTPLTILRGEIEVALKSPKTPEQYREILESNYEETLRLIRIVDNLFYISRLDRSLIQFTMRDTSACEFISRVTSSISILGREKNMKITCVCEKDSMIFIDENQMRQALYNLVDNAIKYGFEGTEIIVKASFNEHTKKVMISVTNQGQGIPDEAKKNIFEPFYRVEGVRNQGIQGAGLGLSVVHSVIKSHNGELWVNSVAGLETTFSIILDGQPADLQ